MSRATYDHVHSYIAVNVSKRQYRCTKTGCPHIINASTLINREALCPHCHTVLIVSRDRLDNKIIAHKGCHATSRSKTLSLFRNGATLVGNETIVNTKIGETQEIKPTITLQELLAQMPKK